MCRPRCAPRPALTARTVLDEAFPEITVDLVRAPPSRVGPAADVVLQILVQGAFTPSNVAALGHRLGIPTTLMFMSCPEIGRAHV